MNPASVLVFLLGGGLVWYDGVHSGWNFVQKPWFVIMVIGALVLTAWHHYLARARKALATGRRDRSERFWRMTNELPFLVAIVVVLAATTKIGG